MIFVQVIPLENSFHCPICYQFCDISCPDSSVFCAMLGTWSGLWYAADFVEVEIITYT